MRTRSSATPNQALRDFERASAAADNHRAIAERYERNRLLALQALYAANWSQAQVAEATGLSRQRVHQLTGRLWTLAGAGSRVVTRAEQEQAAPSTPAPVVAAGPVHPADSVRAS